MKHTLVKPAGGKNNKKKHTWDNEWRILIKTKHHRGYLMNQTQQCLS